jgi:hypothetical protein
MDVCSWPNAAGRPSISDCLVENLETTATGRKRPKADFRELGCGRQMVMLDLTICSIRASSGAAVLMSALDQIQPPRRR